MKKLYLICTIFVLCFITGCREKRMEAVKYESRNLAEITNLVSEENLSDIITIEYSNRELSQIRSADLNLEEMDKKYRIECIRFDDSRPNSYYKVIYKSKNKFLILYFDVKGEKLYDYFSVMSKEKKKFDFVEIYKTKKNSILLLDFGKAEWAPMHTSFKGSRFSRHHTKDGYIIIFEYNKDGFVIDKKVDIL